MLRITLAQLNFTIGDIDGNVQRMLAAARQAEAEKADMVVFSELSLSGYYPGDLLDDPSFLQRVQAGLEVLRSASAKHPQLHWVVGAPTPATGPGKPLHNSLLVLQGGKLRLQYDKQMLPTYNIFDERRHFEPGPDVAKVLRIGPTKVGFLICEDLWNDSGTEYATNPLQRMADAAPDLLVSINASPSHLGKHEQRHHSITDIANRYDLPILYVNQIGGQDQIVFDGGSFAVAPNCGVVFETPRFQESVTTLAFDSGRASSASHSALPAASTQGLTTMEFYRQQIVLGLRDYARRCGFTQVIVGCTGGIDSALTLALAAEAMGANNVVAVTMPSGFSSPNTVDDSVQLCHKLGVTLHQHSVGELVDRYAEEFSRSFGRPLQGRPLENLQARIRGTVLMEFSNTFGHLLLTAVNKTEASVGSYTLYGDTNGGLCLLGDLYKTEVFALARHINIAAGHEVIPQSIIDRPPSAELAPKNENSLPPYAVLDEILKLQIEGTHLSHKEYAEARAFVDTLMLQPGGQALVNKVQGMVFRSEFKRRQSPPILHLRPRAFGIGRQIPIAAYYQ